MPATDTGMMATVEPNDVRERRRRAVRTALLLAAVAVSVFVAFVLTGVLGSR